MLLSSFTGGATAPENLPRLELGDVLLLFLRISLVAVIIFLIGYFVYNSSLSILEKKNKRLQVKTCDNCGQEIPVSYAFCPHCSSSLLSKNADNDKVLSNSNNNKKTAIILTIIVLIIVVAIIIGCVIINYRNEFDSSLTDEHISYNYRIYDGMIYVSITAKVEIKDFSFIAKYYQKDYYLNQYSEYVAGVDLMQGKTYTISIDTDDVVVDNSWIDKWDLDIEIRGGNVKNKDAIKTN